MKAWNESIGAFVSTYGGSELDASLLQMAALRFFPPDAPQLRRTIDAIRSGLTRDGWLFRYRVDDGFGTPDVSFIICSFWLVEALGETRRRDEARALMASLLEAQSPLGLLAEDYDSRSKRLWGNFPQAYSHVGLIHAAFAASPSWAEIL